VIHPSPSDEGRRTLVNPTAVRRVLRGAPGSVELEPRGRRVPGGRRVPLLPANGGTGGGGTGRRGDWGERLASKGNGPHANSSG